MTDIAIQACDLSKRYRLGLTAHAGHSFREMLSERATRLFRHRRSTSPTAVDRRDFWALQGVNFEVRRGEAIGIIGRNGAGKSTLLKILSRITDPTRGYALIHGRVGSLLEVGTGFHPELTGRENIYLNGAVLGMTRAEVARKFDAIVAFAEVERFLTTPVKRYSSGMYVRLAFAVAAHFEPEVLIADEVLAVGDAAFQKKCLGKMSDVAREGRTVLFVSHNMTAVRRLCSRAIHIDHGRAVQDGEATAVIQRYLQLGSEDSPAPQMDLRTWPSRYGSGEARVLTARLLDEQGRPTGVFSRNEPLVLEFDVESHSAGPLNLSAVCLAEDGTRVLHLAHQDTPGFEPGLVTGRATFRVRIPHLPLLVGSFRWILGVHSEFLHPLDVVTDVLPFVTRDCANSPRPFQSITAYGLCSTPSQWALQRNAA